MTSPETLSFSIVSHGQGGLVRPLLEELARWAGDRAQVLVTLNLPEDEGFLSGLPYPVEVLRNAEPKGFGANHNQAFARSRGERFVVLNPDLRLMSVDLETVLAPLREAGIGASAPVVVGPDRVVEDSARRFPSVARIAHRVARRLRGLRNPPDYDVGAAPRTVVDWVAGMFVAFRRDAYAAVGGFDEAYFMYLEDADICRRLGRRGWATVVVGTQVMHDARRATMKNWRHLRWHSRSMARFLWRG
ncbi:glycosyltransferase [Mitsuaria sp. GD03876]|uniref:glycosyltransferase n=1 Tax=Mitsuaria sp. GD03876 TaxID=2975399 RepID=UPI00244759E7|nr:glycosyltransferase [Mitsuaria sp. GD03876]MDH0863262.1 glycosyltransferase [Mitsuaria sp. GD03876]